jgi:hypothetical protein
MDSLKPEILKNTHHKYSKLRSVKRRAGGFYQNNKTYLANFSAAKSGRHPVPGKEKRGLGNPLCFVFTTATSSCLDRGRISRRNWSKESASSCRVQHPSYIYPPCEGLSADEMRYRFTTHYFPSSFTNLLPKPAPALAVLN